MPVEVEVEKLRGANDRVMPFDCQT